MENGAIIGFIILLLYYFLSESNKPINKSYMYTEKNFGDAIQKIKHSQKYSIDILRNVEKIFRLETAHFKSEAFKKTGAGGLEAHGNAPFYGWKTGTEYLKNVFLVPMPENKTGKIKTFIGFKNIEDSICFLAEYLKKYSPERWYSTDPTAQKTYIASLNKIKTHYV